MKKSTMMGCCCKSICKGCFHANTKRESEEGLEHRCAFCREPLPKSQEEHNKQVMKRVKKNDDPVATTEMGKRYYAENEYGKALKYFTKAAGMGDLEAHCCLGDSYRTGEGVEKDMKKAVYHWEKAATGGHPDARHNLANYDIMNGRPDRAAKHNIIAANLGCDMSLKPIKDLFVEGVVSKDEYAAALRGYQAAVDATKSAEREKAEEAKTKSGRYVFDKLGWLSMKPEI